MHLDENKIAENWETLIEKINGNFADPRRKKLIEMYEFFQDRMMLMPASSFEHFHNCFAGGYVDHIIRVMDCAHKVYHSWKDMGSDCSGYTYEELMFAALNHDLGKVGTQELEMYRPNPSEWHRMNQGKMYVVNPNLHNMTVTDRAIYLLNHFGISMSENEYIALRLTDGMYEEANKTYLMQYLDENKVKSNLPILLHQADMLASRIEYENWKHQNDNDVKPEPIKQVNKQEQKKVDGMKKAFDELFDK